ncbi:MAG TPA: ABC transporter ATP-binding protein [Kiritimatiellia bacterium]|nr:ABC transporter ATP-binding protein [Kiritimatiellia bacterium]HNR93602.1 ABC transporter ATP-binding protein [Kiritimatiellia bacterium]HNS80075.1 ABC transporter ATP-binding protein [Kiritimatiellia bacterium]HPA77897.1 ABC transporter ATP-binding protein [Kiritimatiellia bacterium]HQQ03946.1 ABC transporter ATP-binding protein [Kiritimatiellia bacterium]
MAEVLIEIRGVNKIFDLGKVKVHALKDVDLDVYRGEYLSIMGPSGSGKSTLFNMIGALDQPTSGTIRVADISLTDLSSRELAYFRGKHIGYIFQTFNLLPAYNALENVAMPLVFNGWEEARAHARAAEVLEEVGLGHRITHRPEELSGGQQQRVAIARALANKPAIILADEPTGNLDLHTGEEIIRLLSQLSRELGVTVISATHDHKMLATSDRILWIRDGRKDRLEKREDIRIRIGTVS